MLTTVNAASRQGSHRSNNASKTPLPRVTVLPCIYARPTDPDVPALLLASFLFVVGSNRHSSLLANQLFAASCVYIASCSLVQRHVVSFAYLTTPPIASRLNPFRLSPLDLRRPPLNCIPLTSYRHIWQPNTFHARCAFHPG